MVKDYEVIAPLRSGGMALLYLARRRGVGGFNRLVVLKLVHPDLVEDAAMTSLFLAEARISAHVAHPNVVHVEEVGRVGDTYFIAMEYVHGVSLSELLQSLSDRRLRMSPKLCVWVAAQLAEALHAVHEARGENDAPLHIVHRDVSPQNVLIGHTGHVKLIDFGIAKSHPTDDLTGHGRAVLGKLGYMAPEQLRLDRVDRRTDVYALGVLLWEMLSARSLFRCQRIDDEHDWATREAPPAPSEFSPMDHDALDRVVLKAIALDPRDRFETALAFRAALLRAEPTTMQVDAPRFAALMQTLLGEELARRQASLPSELSFQFQMEASATTAKALQLSELTAEILSADDGVDDDGTITAAESPAALRNDSVLASLARLDQARRARFLRETEPVPIDEAAQPTLPSAPGVAIALLREPWPASHVINLPRSEEPSVIFTSLERQIVTEPTARSEAKLVDHRRIVFGRRARFVAIGAICTALGVLLGSSLRPHDPEPAPQPAVISVLRIGAVSALAKRPDEFTSRAESFRPRRDSGVEQARAGGAAPRVEPRTGREHASTPRPVVRRPRAAKATSPSKRASATRASHQTKPTAATKAK
ncbi:MAG: hypothetical protein RLZZ450_5125, partial [Pseudomonadota bacterium]